MATYPLSCEVVFPGVTYRDHIRPEGRPPINFRARVVRKTGPQFPFGHWACQIIQCEDRRFLQMTLIVSEGTIYAMRTGKGIGWAGQSVEVASLPGWWPRPDKPEPYAGLQTP